MGSQLLPKGAQLPVFGSCLLWPNCWMDETKDTSPSIFVKTPLGTEVDIGPSHIVLDGVPALREKGHCSPPPLVCGF